MADLNGKAVAAVSVGMLFVWSGIKGWSIAGTLTDLVTGKKPEQVTKSLTTLDPGTQGIGEAPGIAGVGSAVADAALPYVGHAYRFGGAPGPSGANPWDCSSFVNFVVGVKLGRAIPGNGPGTYKGTVHGPPTGTWAAWSGLKRISRSEVSAGDIIVWLGHMGIAISNTQMVNALNPRVGTKVTKIEGTGRGPIVTMGRLK